MFGIRRLLSDRVSFPIFLLSGIVIMKTSASCLPPRLLTGGWGRNVRVPRDDSENHSCGLILTHLYANGGSAVGSVAFTSFLRQTCSVKRSGVCGMTLALWQVRSASCRDGVLHGDYPLNRERFNQARRPKHDLALLWLRGPGSQ